MTLIEMLVSVSILTVMILAFSTIMVQSQKFISIAQASRRSHAMAFSIARIIRRDCRRISKNGFLAITNNSLGPMLIFTTAGATQGVLTDATGSGGLVSYSLCRNANPGATGLVLARPVYVLRPSSQFAGSMEIQDDATNLDLAQIQLFPREDPVGNPGQTDSILEIVQYVSARSNNASVWLPVRGVADIDDLWLAMVLDCKDKSLSITWTDGEPDIGKNDLRWFGIDAQRDPSNPIRKCRDLGMEGIELDAPGLEYCALWTHHDQKNWPRAIKVRFSVREKGMPVEFRGADGKGSLEYEVICNLE